MNLWAEKFMKGFLIVFIYCSTLAVILKSKEGSSTILDTSVHPRLLKPFLHLLASGAAGMCSSPWIWLSRGSVAPLIFRGAKISHLWVDVKAPS